MAKVIQTSDPRYVRLTRNEMLMLRTLKSGQTFYHVNLAHSNTTHYPNNSKFKAVEILNIGKITATKTIDPRVIIDNSIDLLLLETEANIKVSDLKKEENKKLFLYDNKIGLFESLVDRYSKVLNIKAEDILKRNCYIRKFKII